MIKRNSEEYLKLDLGDEYILPERVLGQGTFGRVFLCRCLKCRKPHNVCVKRIIVINPKVEMKMILEEVYIISQLKHPHIVKFIRSFVHTGTVNIVMEFLPNGTMRDVIDRGPIMQTNLLHFFCDILMGLEYLHIRHVIHRDLKPENLLLTSKERIKICDFGISTIHTPCKQHMNALGTPYYMAPEVLNGEKFDFKSDIWSLGCVLYEMCMGENPFRQATNRDELRCLIRHLTMMKFPCRRLVERYGPVWGRLCEQMLVAETQKRSNLPEIVCLDPLITIPYYKQYFEYDYSETA